MPYTFFSGKMVLPAYTPSLRREDVPRDELIEGYFKQSFTNREIQMALLTVHGKIISISHLKRILRRRGLRRRPRRNAQVPLEETVRGILRIIENSGQCLGYRTVWKRLLSDGFTVTRKTVMELMPLVDPEGVERRRRRRLLRRQYCSPGPNFMWHLDGYDKLKPYGFAIHGAIDGFSRRIMWLEVGPSNNDPSIVASYFLDAVKQIGGCPHTCRCDLGNENPRVQELQTLFHVLDDTNNSDIETCFIYGKSTANQRIEAWWSILRRHAADWWIAFFKDLRDANLFNEADPIHVECIRYCFMDVLQDELNQVAIQWNQHRIQVKKNSDNRGGRPDVMFFIPDAYNVEDYKVSCDSTDIQICRNIYGKDRPLHGCSRDFIELAEILLPNVGRPRNVNEAADLYELLLEEISQRN